MITGSTAVYDSERPRSLSVMSQAGKPDAGLEPTVEIKHCSNSILILCESQMTEVLDQSWNIEKFISFFKKFPVIF